jgi:hypothetical protein
VYVCLYVYMSVSVSVCMYACLSLSPLSLSLCVLTDDELDKYMEDVGSTQRRLVAHSGPVYAAPFSHDSRFLLSCSADATGT